MEAYKIIGPALLLIGAAGALAFSGIFLFRSYRSSASQMADPTADGGSVGDDRRRKSTLWLLLILVALLSAGGYLRLSQLDEKTLSHPEVYVPGIELPADISEPPRRTDLGPLVHFHFHSEPHPPAYYFVMYGWTKVFGTSLFALRFPSVLFGVLSIMLIFLVGRELFGDLTGVVAAAFLTFNGHHIYWSQNARMYAMTCFLGLLSTYLLVKLFKARPDGRSYFIAAGYLLITLLGVYTEILFWALLAGQMIFTFCHRSFDRREADNATPGLIVCLQSMVLMVGAPMWAHAAYTGRQSPMPPPSLSYLGEYLSFGFLFEFDRFSDPVRTVPVWVTLTSVALMLGLITLCLSKREVEFRPLGGRGMPGGSSGLIPIAVFSVMSLIGFVTLISRKQLVVISTIGVVAAALMIPSIFVFFRRRILTRLEMTVGSSFLSGGHFLMILLGLGSVAMVFVVSIFNSLIASRLFLLFTPYLLLLAACGLMALRQRLLLLAPLAALLFVLHFYGVRFYAEYPNEVLDYKQAAAFMMSSSQSGDLFLVPNRSWPTTPIFYYLGNERFQFIADDYGEASKNAHRIWMIDIEGLPPTPEMLQAVSSFKVVARSRFRRCEVLLYERDRGVDAEGK